jgi:hypothetical protein
MSTAKSYYVFSVFCLFDANVITCHHVRCDGLLDWGYRYPYPTLYVCIAKAKDPSAPRNNVVYQCPFSTNKKQMRVKSNQQNVFFTSRSFPKQME